MQIILPLPPSDNERLIRSNYNGLFILSSKYRKYKKEQQERLLYESRVTGRKMYETGKDKLLVINISVFLANWQRDGHNCLKALLDVMEGVVYKNDRYVLPRFLYFGVDKKNPRVEIII